MHHTDTEVGHTLTSVFVLPLGKQPFSKTTETSKSETCKKLYYII